MLQARQIRSALKGLGILLLTVAVAIGGGYLLAEFGPLLAAAGLVALVLALWMLQNIEIAYWAVIGVVCLLPFASFPFEIGFRPTFLDAALGMLFVVWVLRWMTDSERSFTATGLGGPVLLFLLLALTAFVLGLGHAPLTSYVIRHFAEILLSILLFFLVVNTVQDVGRLQRLVRALILCAFAEAAPGLLLYAIPHAAARRDRPPAARVPGEGEVVPRLTGANLAELRGRRIGFVFRCSIWSTTSLLWRTWNCL